MDVTREIYNQLGGNLFSLYSGCKNILRDTEKNALRMTLPKNQSGANRWKSFIMLEKIHTRCIFTSGFPAERS